MHEGVEHFNEVSPPVTLTADGRTALLVIDMQYHDASPDHGLNAAWERIEPGSMTYYNRRLTGTTVPTIERLLPFFRDNAMPVIYLVIGSPYRDLRDCPPRFREWARNLEQRAGIEDLWWSGNPDFRILEELAPREDETIVRKTTNGAFNSSCLDQTLQSMGVENLVITGVVTSACVETTARDAADRGYHSVLVDHGTADYDPEMHDATLRAFEFNLGRIADTAESVIEAIRNGKGV
jgi:nicotinamidase-related amidase